MKTYIDIGANTLGAYRKFKDKWGIDDTWQKIFVEPNPENFETLDRAVPLIPNSMLIKKAMTDTGMPTEIITRADRRGDLAATTMGRDWLKACMAKFDQSADGEVVYPVDAITMWKLMEYVKGDRLYIKMDCEGAEFGILRDWPFYMCDLIEEMYVEFHPMNDEDRLEVERIKQKFKFYGVIIKDWE
jgi:FkbM family methyltransferase